MKGRAVLPGRIGIGGTIDSYVSDLRDDSFDSFRPGTKYRRLAANSASILRPAELGIRS